MQLDGDGDGDGEVVCYLMVMVMVIVRLCETYNGKVIVHRRDAFPWGLGRLD